MTQSPSKKPRTSDMPELELEQEGFTADEIYQLRNMRDMYPYIEYIDSRREMQHLRFVRWLYHKGQIER